MDEIVIGKDAKDNERIVNESKNCYWWFHLNSFPSSHVVIRNCDPSYEQIQKAAELCKSNSKFKNVKNIKVVYTQIENIEPCEDSIGSVNIISRRKCKFMKP